MERFRSVRHLKNLPLILTRAQQIYLYQQATAKLAVLFLYIKSFFFSCIVLYLQFTKIPIGPHKKFNAKASSTFVSLSPSFSIYYGDGSNARGNLGQETVTVAGLSITKQKFALITYEGKI